MRYQQICPVSLASEVLAERWTPLILREIVLFGQTHFSEIQCWAQMPSSLRTVSSSRPASVGW